MTRVKHKVLVTDRLIEDDEHAALEEERAVLSPLGVELVNNYSSNEDDIIAAAKGAVGLLVTYQTITRRVMAALLPELKIVVKYGIGVDNLDTTAAADLGIYTVNVPDYCEEEVAAHALALIMDGLRAVSFTSTAAKEGHWITDLGSLGVRRLSALTVGTVGMGRIAQRLHRYLAPLTPHRRFFDPYVASVPGVQRNQTLKELFLSCDVISLHIPLTSQTKDVISDGVLSSARTGLVLINTARAGIVSRSALLRAVENRTIAYFGTDVAWEEPMDMNHLENRRLLQDARVSITPHMAWYSQESERDVRRKAAMEIARVLNGESPVHIVK